MPIKDFSLSSYKKLLSAFISMDYKFCSMDNFIQIKYLDDLQKCVILRHDVDKKPNNSLNKAIIENQLNIKATYYFRILPCSFDRETMKKISQLGHEIGYHYEDLTLAKGDFDKAIELFRINLDKIRSVYPVKSICAHGSPLSKWDNKLIWEKYNYRDYDIHTDPNFDIDFNQVFYLTDTGMKWNASDVAVRDKAKSNFNYRFDSIKDIISSIKEGNFPERVLINTHPQRWSNNKLELLFEAAKQNIKNVIKKQIVKKQRNH